MKQRTIVTDMAKMLWTVIDDNCVYADGWLVSRHEGGMWQLQDRTGASAPELHPSRSAAMVAAELTLPY